MRCHGVNIHFGRDNGLNLNGKNLKSKLWMNDQIPDVEVLYASSIKSIMP